MSKIYKEYLETPKSSIDITPKELTQRINVEDKGFANIKPFYENIDSSATMDANLLDNNNIGKMYKYIGTSDNKYSKHSLYICEKNQLVEPLTFTANTAGSTIELLTEGSPAWTGSYSIDGSTWNTYTPGTTGAITLTNIGDKVYFKGDIAADFDEDNYLQFSMGGSIAASGNINSMYVSSNFENLTTLTYKHCYYSMFYECTSLKTSPILPAVTLTEWCYSGMFGGCTSLTTAPKLPATTLAEGCYAAMFGGCTSLTTAPKLPATTLADGCYFIMFGRCTSLMTLPELPATTLPESCYQWMFNACTSLIVSDTSGTGYDKIWKIPSNSICVAQNQIATANMFYDCGGTRSTNTPTLLNTQATYYTQNAPI